VAYQRAFTPRDSARGCRLVGCAGFVVGCIPACFQTASSFQAAHASEPFKLGARIYRPYRPGLPWTKQTPFPRDHRCRCVSNGHRISMCNSQQNCGLGSYRALQRQAGEGDIVWSARSGSLLSKGV